MPYSPTGAPAVSPKQTRLLTDRRNIFYPNEPERNLDLQRFIEGLQIRDTSGKLRSLILRPAQELILHAFLDADAQNKPLRLIVGKIRQLGISTVILACIFARCYERSHQNALVISHQLTSSLWLFGITRVYFESLSPAQQAARPLTGARPTQDTLRFDSPHSSQITVGTAENLQVARGSTLQWVHCSEAAFWRRPDELMAALQPAIHNIPGTGMIIESTWNGRNWFDSTFNQALTGENDFTPLFLGLKDFPIYSLPMAPGETLDLREDEALYQQKNAIPDGLMKFVVKTKRGPTCDNEWAIFNREYPVSIEVARSESGYGAFNAEALDFLASSLTPPLATAFIELGAEAVLTAVHDPSGDVQIWEYPTHNAAYMVACDVSEGIGHDFHCAHVLKITNPQNPDAGDITQAALFRNNRMDTWTAGLTFWRIAQYYNWAYLAVESNGPGLLVCQNLFYGFAGHPDTLRGYPNIHATLRQNTTEQTETGRIGWQTTSLTRPIMIAALARRIRHTSITLRCATTHAELAGYYCEPPKAGRAPRYFQRHRDPITNGHHDDTIMSLALACAVLREYRKRPDYIPKPILKELQANGSTRP